MHRNHTIPAMAKSEKKQENAIIENLPAVSGQWIKQPWNLTFVKGEMTLTQLNIMFSLVEKLQTNINEALKKKSLSLFPDDVYDENKNLTVSVALSDVTDHPQRYNDVEISAYRLFNIKDYIEYTDPKGEKRRKLTHLFVSVDIPVVEGTKRRKGEINFEINKSMVDQVFQLPNYINYIKGIVGNFRKGYTARLYMYIKAYLYTYDKEKGFGKWNIGYQELREMLGCRVWESPGVDENGKPQKETWVEKKYAKYKNFKARVLEDSRIELEELAKENKIECYFSYDEIADSKAVYEDGPKKINFKIWITDFGKAQQKAVDEKSNIYKIEGILRNELNLKTSQIRMILNLVNPENSELLTKKVVELKSYILNNKDEIKDVKKYIYKCLQQALKEGSESVVENPEREEEYVEYEEIKSDSSPTISEPTVELVDNRCTDAVKKFWDTRWHGGEHKNNISEINELIETLDLGLKEDIPHYDISKLDGHLKLFMATCSQYPTSAVILDFIKTKEGIKIEKYGRQQTNPAPAAGQGYDRRRAAPISLDAPPEAYEKPKKIPR